MENLEPVCSYALSRIFACRPALAREIVARLGSASAIFSLDKEGLTEVFGPCSPYRDGIGETSLDKTAAELEGLRQKGYGYMYCTHPDYPEALSMCPDAPVGFFVRASDSFRNIFSREKVSVVGTRDMSSYGREWCGKIVETLGATVTRPTIVSGLAFGIDITAHLNALKCSLPTIAVLGTGVDLIYPSAHSGYADRIIGEACSAVITEYPPGAAVTGLNFLCRNRIIAGLSKATVLVESRLRGGGMTTARQAASYGREVYAVPGRVDDVLSQGCNLLIQSQIAEPVFDMATFLKSLGYRQAGPVAAVTGISPDERYGKGTGSGGIDVAGRILLAIRSSRDITIDAISAGTGIPYKEVAPIVARLEADGLIRVDLLQRCSINKV